MATSAYVIGSGLLSVINTDINEVVSTIPINGVPRAGVGRDRGW
jgi:hypothetical protein